MGIPAQPHRRPQEKQSYTTTLKTLRINRDECHRQLNILTQIQKNNRNIFTGDRKLFREATNKIRRILARLNQIDNI